MLIARLLAASCLAVPMLAHAWWNEDWTVHKTVTVDGKAAGLATEVADAPVMVRLHTGNFDFLNAKEDGADLRFIGGDDATPLKFHIERFDALNELALVWVRIPKAGASAQAIHLYAGNADAPPASDAKGSYDTPTAAVYHFAEATGLPQDSTAYVAHAAASNAKPTEGLIGGGLQFTGAQKLELPALPALAQAKAFSFSAWIKPAEAQDATLLVHGALSLVLTGNHVQADVNGAALGAPVPLAVATWSHVALTVGDGRAVLYVNGQQVAETAAQYAPAGASTFGAGFKGKGFIGAMDELQFAAMARGADWMKLAAAQGPDGKLLSFGADESTEGGGGGSSTFTVLADAVMEDIMGLLVVALLFVMALVSWLVMALKAVYVNRTDSENEAFIEAFRGVATDLAALDKPGALSGEFHASSIYRIYHVGVEELKRRFKDTDASHAHKSLSAQALNSIRASLDAALVRELHRLNKLMVLLTIAISGGPFLGLLGTVIGVMITFAIVASSGNVDVNSIAPGMAAALVATVAGLVVAIPALFGYNYLTTRIKGISADMRVFVDEYIAKLAELYAE
jgi:biopolymer transport protein ExbB